MVCKKLDCEEAGEYQNAENYGDYLKVFIENISCLFPEYSHDRSDQKEACSSSN